MEKGKLKVGEIMMDALKEVDKVAYVDLHLFIETFKILKIFLLRSTH